MRDGRERQAVRRGGRARRLNFAGDAGEGAGKSLRFKQILRKARMPMSSTHIRAVWAWFLIALLGCRSANHDPGAAEDAAGAGVAVVRIEAPAAAGDAASMVVVEPARTVLEAEEVHVPMVLVGSSPFVEWTDEA